MEYANPSAWYIILGSFLALLTSLVVEFVKSWTAGRHQSRDFKITMRLELKGTLSLIDRLVTEYGTNQFFSFSTLGDLRFKLQRLDKLRDNVIYLRNDIKMEEVLLLLNDIDTFHSDASSIESNAFRNENPIPGPKIEWNDERYKSQRQMLAIRSIDIKRKIQDLVNYLEIR